MFRSYRSLSSSLGGAKATAELPFAAVSVGIHPFLPLLYLGVSAPNPWPQLPGAFVVVVGFLRARGSPAPVGLVLPLGFEWAGSVRPALRAGGQ